jgi:hypothetical protein
MSRLLRDRHQLALDDFPCACLTLRDHEEVDLTEARDEASRSLS